MWAPPKRWVFRNYAEVWARVGMARYVLNTVIISVPSVVGALLVSSSGAFALAFYRFRLNKPVLIVFITGLGVLNTMFMSVLERTGEIGVMRAFGLRRWQTVGLFFVEAVAIAAVGGVAGLALGSPIVIFAGNLNPPDAIAGRWHEHDVHRPPLEHLRNAFSGCRQESLSRHLRHYLRPARWVSELWRP